MEKAVRSNLLESASEYVKVDIDDPVFLIAFDAAVEIVEGAVGRFDTDSARAKLALILITQNLYDNRTILESKNNEKISYIARTILLQLKLDNDTEDTDG